MSSRSRLFNKIPSTKEGVHRRMIIGLADGLTGAGIGAGISAGVGAGQDSPQAQEYNSPGDCDSPAEILLEKDKNFFRGFSGSFQPSWSGDINFRSVTGGQVSSVLVSSVLVSSV